MTALHQVLADAMSLTGADREYVEQYLRASRVAGLDSEPDSLRRTTDDALRQLWDKGKIAERATK